MIKLSSFYSGVVAGLLCVSGQVCIAGSLKKQPEPTKVSKKIEPIRAIECDGSVRISLDGGGKSSVIFSTPNKKVQVARDKHTLKFTGSHDKTFTSDVIVYKKALKHVSELKVMGACSVEGYDLHLPSLNLITRSQGDVKLRGEIGAYAIDQAGRNRVDVLWVDAKHVEAVVVDGELRLAGVTDHLNIKAFGGAKVKTRNLRAKGVWLLASDTSYVDLFASDMLSSFTSGHANVVSRKRPSIISDVSKDSAIMVFEELD